MNTLRSWLYKVNGIQGEIPTSLVNTETSSHFCKPHQTLTLVCSSCGHQYVAEINCGDRLCRHCGEKAAWRLRKRYLDNIRKIRNPRLLTLTLPTTKDLTKARVRFIRASFSKLRRRRYVEARMKGGLYSIEIKKSRCRWNIHIHALVTGSYMHQAEISRLWQKITGAVIVDIRKAWGIVNGLDYILKYIAKPPIFRDISDQDAYRKSMKGFRLIQDFGNLFRTTTKTRFYCPDCGCCSWECVEYVDELRLEGWWGWGPIP